MLRQPNAGVEKRAFRIVVCDPRRSVTCAAVRLQTRFTTSLSRPLTVASAYHVPLTAPQNLTTYLCPMLRYSHDPEFDLPLFVFAECDPFGRFG